MKKNHKAIPVTILSGFLGSGKTTLLQHVLTSKEHQQRIAVIVNDMAELNVDAQTIQRTEFAVPETMADDEHRASVKTIKPELITLENGCICCNLRGDLIREIHRICHEAEGSIDYIIIESTGIAEPQQVAESFCVDPETMTLASDMQDMVKMLHKSARLDTCVTVVDASNFPQHLSSLKRFNELFQDGLDEKDEEEEGQKSIAELMVEQVEFANVVLLNKIDLVSKDQVAKAKALIRSLNRKARVVTASHGKMDVKDVLNTGLFDMEEAKQSPGWMVSLQKTNGVFENSIGGEADEYGVASFVYRASKPFHPQRLNDEFLSKILNFAGDWNTEGVQETVDKAKQTYMEERYGSILRSKGCIWIAGRDQHEYELAHAGRIIGINPISPWYCTVPEEKWGYETQQEKEAILRKIAINEDSGYGDRRQEIVFIGMNMKEDQIRNDLDACLLTEDETLGHALDLPLGAYHDTLPPLPFSCFDARSVFTTLRPRQNQHFIVPPEFKLTLSNLALVTKCAGDNDGSLIRLVRVWLDKGPRQSRHGVLLATLRPEVYEQHSFSLSLLHSEGESSESSEFCLRIEAVMLKRGNKRKRDDKLELDETCVQVHLVGSVEPVPYLATDDDVGSGDDDENNCPDGECNMH